LNIKCHAQAIIGEHIHQSGKDQEAQNVVFQEAKELKSEISQLGKKLLEPATNFILSWPLPMFAVPNDTHPLTPLGAESEAVILSTCGPKPIPGYQHLHSATTSLSAET